MADAAAAAVGRDALVQARPGLDPAAEVRVVAVDVAGGEVLDDLDLAGVLADAAEGDAEAWVVGVGVSGVKGGRGSGDAPL